MEMFGCLYIYPVGHPFNDPEPAVLPDDCDAVVNFWVTEACFEAGLHHHVYELVERWMATWPFRSPRVVPNLRGRGSDSRPRRQLCQTASSPSPGRVPM